MIEIAPALPWLVPASLVAFLASVLASSGLGRRLSVRRTTALFLLFGLGFILASTLSPLDREGVTPTGIRACDLSRTWPASFADLLYGEDVVVNVLLFVPLGLSIGIAPSSLGKAAAAFGAIALPFAIEATQLLVVPLGRACQGADVVDNLTGLAVGLAAGGVVAWLVPAVRRPTETPD